MILDEQSELVYIQCEGNQDIQFTWNGSSIVLNGVPTSTDCDNTIPVTKCDCETACGDGKPSEATKETTSDDTFSASNGTPDTTVILPSTNSEAKTAFCPTSSTVAVLGALVGLLGVLLAIVSSTLVLTCWIMGTKREMKITSEQPR